MKIDCILFESKALTFLSGGVRWNGTIFEYTELSLSTTNKQFYEELREAEMKKFLVFSIAVLTLCSFATKVQADLLTGSLVSGKYTQFATTDGDETGVSNVGHINVKNINTGGQFIAFCGDHGTMTSANFSNANKGQAYGAMSMFDDALTIYTDQQKTDINSVFGYLYGNGFDTATGAVKDKTTAVAMQLLIWEILSEPEGGYDLYGGDFLVETDFYIWDGWINGVRTQEERELTKEHLDILSKADEYMGMLLSGDWGENVFTQYDMTVYVAEGGTHVSQTLISIEDATTPEPASLLIFGVGLAFGAPMIRRRMKNRKNRSRLEMSVE